MLDMFIVYAHLLRDICLVFKRLFIKLLSS